MQQRIEHAIRQALEARQKADACIDTHAREQWLQVATMWEEFAGTCERLQKVRDAATGAMIPEEDGARPVQ